MFHVAINLTRLKTLNPLTSKRHGRQDPYLAEGQVQVTGGSCHDDAQPEDVDAHSDDQHEAC